MMTSAEFLSISASGLTLLLVVLLVYACSTWDEHVRADDDERSP